ncbi:hypothetical protein [Saccharopolyspora pogona]|uniref:hypothetical protein n=1 Tax=Saccharopolyspora pogona TaxID=333966 RepID=UPI0016858CFC|nr:hypothetical protein [Saccharopolyspora pogona]
MQVPESPTQEPVVDAAIAAKSSSGDLSPVQAGRSYNWCSPFVTGMAAAAGVAVTYGVIELIIAARQVLILIGYVFFIATGSEPTVSWLIRHRLPRRGSAGSDRRISSPSPWRR